MTLMRTSELPLVRRPHRKLDHRLGARRSLPKRLVEPRQPLVQRPDEERLGMARYEVLGQRLIV